MAPDNDLIREWLTEYKSLDESSLPKYASSIKTNQNLINALSKYILSWSKQHSEENNSNIVSVCHQLFEFCKSSCDDLNLFTTNVLPAIILSYLTSASLGKENSVLGALLFAIYSIENASHDIANTEVPTISKPSMYHKPNPISTILGEFPGMKTQSTSLVVRSNWPMYKTIIASNRLVICAGLMEIFADKLSLLQKTSLQEICHVCTALASIGFPWQQQYLPDSEESHNRIQLNNEFCLTILRAVYFALYNGCWDEATVAFEAMQRRSQKEITPQILLFCNAVLHSAKQEESASQNVHKDNCLGIHMNHRETYGLSAHLTPILSRSGSKKRPLGRFMATAKSIREHKWRHQSEEVSGDYSESISSHEDAVVAQSDKLNKVVITTDDNETNVKPDKVVSPAKLLKSKLKKASNEMRSPQTSKDKSIEKKTNKRHSSSKEDMIEKTKESKSHRLSKHSSLDENVHFGVTKQSSFIKSSSDNISSTTNSTAGTSSLANKEKSLENTNISTVTVNNGSPGNSSVHSPLLGNNNSDNIDTSSENEKTSDKIKDSFPLLTRKSSKTFKDGKGTKQQATRL